MKLIDGLVLTEVGDEWVAVPTGEASDVLHGIVRLNKTAKFVWDGLAEGLSEDELVARMLDVYDVDGATAAEAVSKVIDQLRSAQLIEG